MITTHLAFVLDHALAGSDVDPARALRAVGAVHGAVLIGAEVVTGPVAVSPLGLDLGLEAVLVEVGGQVVDSGAGAGIPGGPLAALVEAVAAGRSLEPGDIVLSGPLTEPVLTSSSMPVLLSMSVHFTHLGSLYVPATAAA